MRRAHQIVLPAEDVRGSLIAQIHAFQKALGRTPCVLTRSVNKQFGVTRGLDELDASQLAEVLDSLERLIEHEEEVERVREACRDNRFTQPALDDLLDIHFDGRELAQLSNDELTDLRIRIESRGGMAAAAETAPGAEVLM